MVCVLTVFIFVILLYFVYLRLYKEMAHRKLCRVRDKQAHDWENER